MNAYQSVFAELYDLFYQQKPYEAEVDFLHQKLSSYGVKNILELACGTGSHALRLAALGYSVVATDASADMILQARTKQQQWEQSGKLPLGRVSFLQADMANLPEQIGNNFDSVLCLFDSLGYLVDNATLRKTLQNIYSKLKENGIFIVEYWHGAAMARHYQPVRIRRWQTPEAQVVRFSETTIDYLQQVAQVYFTIHQIFHDGRACVYSEMHRNRFFLVQEMNAFLENAGFQVVETLRGYSGETSIDADTWHVLAIARKV
ncbi:MAG: class I SAM-dependent methyltransferase [Cytophagales bacterium]|nr:class I SAM-dependent methyltransferase [Bernardetiaceae bacterium]MDW8211619.1 class I SAM-dependent methyltransferase [Cytophagales bacterium]